MKLKLPNDGVMELYGGEREMYKLYKKSEIWFAIGWIIIYVIGTSVADSVSDKIGTVKLITLILHIILCIIILAWIKKYNLYKKYGLCRSKVAASKYLYYIPLIVIVSCNLWFGVTMNLSVHETIIYIGSMICVGFLEEIIFRGFLFKAMCKDNVKSAIVISSITFGIGHIVNLINGSGADIVSNLCQVCYAVAFGFLFVILFHRGKSLLPCIITHSAVNALSVFANQANLTMEVQIITSLILTLLAIGYTLILLKTLPQGHNNI